jgi:hypothetical protein
MTSASTLTIRDDPLAVRCGLRDAWLGAIRLEWLDRRGAS